MLARPLRRDEQAAIDRAAERAVCGLVGSVRQARVRLLKGVECGHAAPVVAVVPLFLKVRKEGLGLGRAKLSRRAALCQSAQKTTAAGTAARRHIREIRFFIVHLPVR